MTHSEGTAPQASGKEKRQAQSDTGLHALETEALRLVSEVESLASSFGFLMRMTEAVHAAASKEWREFLGQKGEPFSDAATGKKRYRVSALNYEESRKLDAKRARAERALQTVPRSFVVSLSSVFDVFIGRLIRVLFRENPELLGTIKRELKLEDIQQFERVKQVEDMVLDEEIEGVIRDSRRRQFDWMEKKFAVPLTKSLDCWSRFVELSERRNLFVHTDGVVSKQYKRVCQEVGLKWNGEEPALTTTLDATPEYFDQACNTTIEVGLKLLWVSWRKQAPSELLRQDRSFVNLTYGLIADDRFEVASELLDFALSEPAWKFYDEDSRIRSLLNLAQAYKWSGRKDQCSKTLGRQDWSSLSPVFRLGALILQERFEEAALVLPNAVNVDELNEGTFVQWPIFREFRETEAFRRAFKEAFGLDYESVDSSIGSSGASSNEESGKRPQPNDEMEKAEQVKAQE